MAFKIHGFKLYNYTHNGIHTLIHGKLVNILQVIVIIIYLLQGAYALYVYYTMA